LLGESSILVDTAGIRRKARIDDRIERFSVSRSLQAVDRADLVIHVIDGPENATDQDAQVLSYACQRGKAVVLAVNKWDLVSKSGGTMEKYRAEVNYRLAFLEFVPIVFIAAATGYGLRGLSETAARVLKAYRRKVSTSAVNQALQKIVRAHSAPLARGKPVKFFYATQSGTRPPTFTVFVNTPGCVLDSYKKYLIHQLQEQLGFEQTPIRLDLRARREPKPRKRA
jgi:GTP-binding protein